MTGAKCLSVVCALAGWILVTAATPYNEATRLYKSGQYRLNRTYCEPVKERGDDLKTLAINRER